MRSRPLLQKATDSLIAAGLSNATHEAQWLLGRVLDLSYFDVHLNDCDLSPAKVEQFEESIAARARGVPLQYLLGSEEFFGARFIVERGVFIPRPETECLVEAVMPLLQNRHQNLGRELKLLDLGTGSGCIAVTLARFLPACAIVGIDVSWLALSAARRNVARHGCASRINLIHGNWTRPLRGLWDGVIANPPYIPSAAIRTLPSDVQQEPLLSLDGGSDGLRNLQILMRQLPLILHSGAIVAFECAEDQVNSMLAQAGGSSWVATAHPMIDSTGRLRGVLLHRK